MIIILNLLDEEVFVYFVNEIKKNNNGFSGLQFVHCVLCLYVVCFPPPILHPWFYLFFSFTFFFHACFKPSRALVISMYFLTFSIPNPK